MDIHQEDREDELVEALGADASDPGHFQPRQPEVWRTSYLYDENDDDDD